METTNSDQIINQALAAIQNAGVTCEVGTLSTFITGFPEQVWQTLRTLCDTASSEAKELSIVVTISNSKK